MNRGQRCLSLSKGRHRFVFWYHAGRESDLLASFLGLANDDDSVFDWFDAAVLAYQMGKQTELQLDPVSL